MSVYILYQVVVLIPGSRDRLIFIMRIPLPEKAPFMLKRGPGKEHDWF